MSKSIYLVLDMQNDLIHAEGPSGKGPMVEQVNQRNIIQNTQRVIEKARKAGVPVGYVRVGFTAGYPECSSTSALFKGIKENGLLQLDVWGGQVHDELKPQPGDLQIIKHRVSPFYSTTLQVQLKAQGITHIYCSGVSTQAVVQATVRDAHDRDFEVTLIEDGCAAHSLQEHQNSVQSISRFCNVTSAEAVTFA